MQPLILRALLPAAVGCALAVSVHGSAAPLEPSRLDAADASLAASASVLFTEDEKEKATEWPKAADESALIRSVAKVRKATSDEMEAAGRAELEFAGAEAAPYLLRALGREKDADVRSRIAGALNLVTSVEYTRVLAESFAHKSPAVRQYAMRRVAELGDSGLRERAEEICTDYALRSKDPRRAKKMDGDDLPWAAVLAISTGSPVGVEPCLEIAGSKAWPQWRDTLRSAATSAKSAGPDVPEALREALRPSADLDNSTQVAALRLIAYAGTKDHARAVLPSLDASANHVKIAAVNALRMMVDGAKPLDKLSTFDAIERANKWKSRL